MATIYLRLSTKSDKATSQHEILMRFKHGAFAQRAKTNIFVHPDYWNDEKQSIIIPNWRLLTHERKQLREELKQKSDRLGEMVSLVQTTFQAQNKKDLAKDWLTTVIDSFNFPETANNDDEKPQQENRTFFDWFELFLKTKDYPLNSANFWQ